MTFHARAISRPNGETSRLGARAAVSQSSLPAELRAFLGLRLRALYESSPPTTLPPRITELLAQIEALGTRDPSSPSVFRDDLLALLPDLRGFARSIATDASHADDLVQETLLKAWQKQHLYRSGTNLKAWLFTILRNQFYTELRHAKREIADVDGAAASRLITPSDQDHHIALKELMLHIETLPEVQQEALLLVAGQGMTYEEASEILGCQVGTVKSRVCRARGTLAAIAVRHRTKACVA